jgi:glycerol-3-phosphate acyltransferase PlsY
VVFAGYGLGSFPSATLVSRRVGRDPSREGSGNPGASNVYRLMGRRAGVAVLLADVAKGAAAALVGLALAGRAGLFAAGIAAVVGHCFPLGRWRRGGKGVATAAGLGLVAFPGLAVVGVGAWALVAAITRKASLASLAAIVAVTASTPFIGRPAAEVAATAATAALVVARHAGNLKRLAEGEERSLH